MHEVLLPARYVPVAQVEQPEKEYIGPDGAAVPVFPMDNKAPCVAVEG